MYQNFDATSRPHTNVFPIALLLCTQKGKRQWNFSPGAHPGKLCGKPKARGPMRTLYCSQRSFPWSYCYWGFSLLFRVCALLFVVPRVLCFYFCIIVRNNGKAWLKNVFILLFDQWELFYLFIPCIVWRKEYIVHNKFRHALTWKNTRHVFTVENGWNDFFFSM